MAVGLLYSGGTDSTLAAILLDPVCEVTLLGCTFGVTDDYEHAREAARAVGFPFQRVDLEESVAHEAIEEMVADGYPRNGIQMVHEHALERAASLAFDAVADGTRRDDRVPRVERSLAQSIEDRHDVAHLAPLAGIGRGAIDALAEAHLTVETGPSETLPTGDYEAELRALLAEEYGPGRVAEIFPAHTQSRVTGRKQ
ncbi:MAG: putative subunit of tRNA(5-methylaminomethyl-2-thiouridylate) methyltransferase [Haloarculaceae archaeon]|jgi:predicted subunit of tRNA(5-methylaminomethyl-2-thiouridylate) methyltransferase